MSEFFLRFTAPDPEAHARSIAAMREQLALLQAKAGAGEAVDETVLLEVAADLAGLLITARQEGEALQLLQAHEALAQDPLEAPAPHEVLGWFWCAYATALQYLGQRAEAEPIFARTVDLCEAGGWLRLRAMVLQHWGRSLVEQGRFDEAESRFQQALALRVQLQDPRQATTREALALLAQLRHPV